MAPDSPSAQLLLARAQKRNKDYPGAIKSINDAIKIAPVWAEAWFALGSTYEESGDQANAENSYRTLAQLEPKNPVALMALASYLVDQKKYDDVAGLIARIREQNPPKDVMDAAKTLEDKASGKSSESGK